MGIDIKIKNDEPRLEEGMIVLDPNAGEPRFWTVATANTRSIKLVAHVDGKSLEATITGTAGQAPDGWHVIDHSTIIMAFEGSLDGGLSAFIDVHGPAQPELTAPA